MGIFTSFPHIKVMIAEEFDDCVPPRCDEDIASLYN